MILAAYKSNMVVSKFKLFFALGMLLCATPLFSQKAYRNQELSITTENDVYLLIRRDRYYSNGILFNYRFTKGEVSNSLDSSTIASPKKIFQFDLAQKFFTPEGITLSNPDEFDRPYAGLLVGGASVSLFPKPDKKISYGAELGVIGEISGGEAFQKWYHRFAGFLPPEGWEFQIRNEVFLNLKAEINKQFTLLPRTIDVVTHSKVSLGTSLLNTQQGFDVRFGKLQNIDRSAFVNSLIGRGSERFVGHNYFFFGYGLEYVVHNTLIGGSIWNIESPHTEELNHLVRHWRIGWAANSETATFKMTYYHLSEEVVGAKKHAYIGLELQLRFRPSKKRSQ